jgi:micrococcal nuclease
MKIIGLLVLLAAFPAYARSEISGTCLVIDGDSIDVISGGNTTTNVRLYGIAAPEMNQWGGKQAAAFLEKLADGKPVRCVLEETNIRQFEIGTCYVGGQDLAAAVVRAGWARDCPRLSGGKYRTLESPQTTRLFFPSYCK